MMTGPEDWGAEISSYKMPREPEMIWYIEPEYARMTLSAQLRTLLSTPKIMANFSWIGNGGILLIIWATGEINGLEKALTEIALRCGIPITTLAY